MSKYTTEVRFICENYAGLDTSVGYNSTADTIAHSREKVFDFPYPIFDEAYRSVLETKILKHFYTREIGAESVGLWKLWLDTRLNEIMPYYNQLYKSELIEFNPLYNVDITTDHKRDNNGSTNETDNFTENDNRTRNLGVQGNTGETSTVSDDVWSHFSDTPQGGIDGVADMTYLTNATHNTDTNSGSRTGNYSETTVDTDNMAKSGNSTKNNLIVNTEDYLEHVKGKTGGESYSKLLQEYRQTFMNIDMQVINELNDLFMNLW